jgi:hypothetical protein
MATIHEGIVWEFTADASAVVDAYQKATKASEQSGAAAQRAAQSANVSFDKLTQGMTKAGAEARALGDHIVKGMSLSAAHARELAVANDNVRGSFLRVSLGAQEVNQRLEKIRAFAWNNTSLSGQDIDRVINPIQGLVSKLGAVPTIAAVAAAGVGALAVAVGAFADNQLAKLAEISKETGLSPNTVAGAKLVGAGAGLGSDATFGALKNAAQQFEQFKRNAGEVKDAVEKIDESFLPILDKAKTLGEFTDILGQKIRELPRQEGIDLSKALYGDEAGQKLNEPILRLEFEMKNLADQARYAGVAIDENLVQKAEESRKHIDEAAAVAGGKMLTAMQALAPVVESIKVGFSGWVGALADATANALKFVGEMRQAAEYSKLIYLDREHHQTGGEAASSVFARLRRGNDSFYRLTDPFGTPAPPESAGVSRKRYADRDKDGSGSKAAKSQASPQIDDKSAAIVKNLQDQLALLESTGAEHDKIALKIKIEQEQTRAGKDATAAEKEQIAGLVTKIDDATHAQEHQREAVAATASAVNGLGQAFESALEGVIFNGEKADKVIKNLLQSIARSSLQSTLLGQGPFAKLLGTDGKDGAAGGLFGALFSGNLGSLIPKFAAGGNLGPGRIGLVGEAGPELIRGPASVSPLAQLRASAAASVQVHNYSGAPASANVTAQGVQVIVGQALRRYDAQLQTTLAEKQDRSWG